jgi:hypothetical protein
VKPGRHYQGQKRQPHEEGGNGTCSEDACDRMLASGEIPASLGVAQRDSAPAQGTNGLAMFTAPRRAPGCSKCCALRLVLNDQLSSPTIVCFMHEPGQL